jgi:hypothetical protein
MGKRKSREEVYSDFLEIKHALWCARHTLSSLRENLKRIGPAFEEEHGKERRMFWERMKLRPFRAEVRRLSSKVRYHPGSLLSEGADGRLIRLKERASAR